MGGNLNRNFIQNKINIFFANEVQRGLRTFFLYGVPFKKSTNLNLNFLYCRGAINDHGARASGRRCGSEECTYAHGMCRTGAIRFAQAAAPRPISFFFRFENTTQYKKARASAAGCPPPRAQTDARNLQTNGIGSGFGGVAAAGGGRRRR